MIKLENLCVSYEDLDVISDLHYTFTNNAITVLYGPSGCGKTTLLNAMAGLVCYSGHIIASANVSYIFQEDRLLPWMTVYDNVAFVLKEMPEEKRQERIMHHLTLVGLENHKDDYPDQLSGGMKRRVSIARAFAYPSEILLMDEPFKGLDKTLKDQIMGDFLSLWQEDRRTVVFVTHDEYEAKFLGTKIIELKGLPLEIVNEKHV